MSGARQAPPARGRAFGTQDGADSPQVIIVNEDEMEFYKQPMYYGFGHVSRFIPEASVRVELTEVVAETTPNLVQVAAQRPDGGIVVVFLNRDVSTSRTVAVVDPDRGTFETTLAPSSMTTILYW